MTTLFTHGKRIIWQEGKYLLIKDKNGLTDSVNINFVVQ